MSESILQSVKHDLEGITPENTHFDPDIIRDINGALVILHDLGMWDKIKVITGAEETWDDLFEDEDLVHLVKPWLVLKVQLVFDKTMSGTTRDSVSHQKDEYEWRINQMLEENQNGSNLH